MYVCGEQNARCVRLDRTCLKHFSLLLFKFYYLNFLKILLVDVQKLTVFLKKKEFLSVFLFG